jgi:bifunctional DNA-binding transcriptional regulator/antitoxin component of YhaV-PrlF toxin-antitoxin module
MVLSFSMQTTVTTKNMVTIPAELSRRMGITPGCRLEWHEPEEGSDEVRVRVIPTRADLARRLMGSARKWSPERDAVGELVEERAREDGAGLKP